MNTLDMLRQCFENGMHHKSEKDYQVVKMNGLEWPDPSRDKWL